MAHSADGLSDENDADDADGGYSPHRRPQGKDVYECPNCDEALTKKQFVRVSYRSVVEAYLDLIDAAKRTAKAAIETSPTKPRSLHDGALSTPNHFRTIPPTRPSTAPGARQSVEPRPRSAHAATGEAANAPQQVAALSSWVAPPKVLSRLNFSIEELMVHPQRLRRLVAVCTSCAASLGVTPAQEDARASKSLMNSVARASLENKTMHDSIGIADAIVTTELQQHHRWIRQSVRLRQQGDEAVKARSNENIKLEAEKMAREARDLREIENLLRSLMLPAADTQPSTEVHEEESKDDELVKAASAAAMMDSPEKDKSRSFPRPCSVERGDCAMSDPNALGPGPDVPLHHLLMNDLYHRVTSIALRHADEQKETFAKLNAKNPQRVRFPFPPPPELVAAEELDDPIRQLRLLIASRSMLGRNVAYKALRSLSTSFGEFSDEERLVIVSSAAEPLK
jgi:hypothetical protein